MTKQAVRNCKTVVVCSNVYPPYFIGGAELVAHHQAMKLRERNHTIIVFAGDPHTFGDRYSMWEDSYDGLPVFRVRLAAQDFRPEYVNFVHPEVDARFDEVLDRFRPDVVHMHNLTGLSAGLVHKARRRGIKTVLTLHDHWAFCYKNTLLKSDWEICQDFRRCAECMSSLHDGNNRAIPIRLRQDYLAMALAEVDTLISPSLYLARAYIRAGVSPRKIRVISNGVDVHRFSRLSKVERKGPLRFSFVGHLGHHKGVILALEALRYLPPGSAVINLVGDGELMPALRQRAQELGCTAMVRFWGKVDNRRIEEVFRETDALLLPSIWPENQPVSITEAMASRTPVIAARIGGIPELVTDGVTGYLFEPGNAADLAAKMSELIRRPEAVRELGEAAFRRIAGDTFENYADQISAVYDEPPVGSEGVPGLLVACAGDRFDPDSAEALENFMATHDRQRYKFVMAEWLSEDQLREASVVWVVDRSHPGQFVSAALRSGIPLLVPEDNKELQALCSRSNSGLYFANAEEATECLAYLLRGRATGFSSKSQAEFIGACSTNLGRVPGRDTSTSTLEGSLFTAGRQFELWDPIVSTTVFHWFTPTEGNVSGPWIPVEGRPAWTGQKDWWMSQIKQMMLANIDVIYLHLITRFEQQRINFFEALSELRSQGYDVPKVAPFLDPFGIWHQSPIDMSIRAGKDEYAAQYIRFFKQYFGANRDEFADSYIAKIDNRVVLCTWWVYGILQNLDAFRREDLESRLQNAGLGNPKTFDKGIYLVSTALIDPDLKFCDERQVMFSGYAYCIHATHNGIHSFHLQPGYWDQNIRRPGFFLPRNGGKPYKNAWDYVLQECNSVHRIYVESWNEYDEGSGIYAANPGPPFIAPGAPADNTDCWSAHNDPLEYIRTTAWGAANFNRRPAYNSRILAHELPKVMRAGESATARVVVRNEGNALWSGSGDVAFALKTVTPGATFGKCRYKLDDGANEVDFYGGIFRGRPVTLRLDLVAPPVPGRYRTIWSMVRGTNGWFGEELEADIDVVS